jgi:hypothetical protein
MTLEINQTRRGVIGVHRTIGKDSLSVIEGHMRQRTRRKASHTVVFEKTANFGVVKPAIGDTSYHPKQRAS